MAYPARPAGGHDLRPRLPVHRTVRQQVPAVGTADGWHSSLADGLAAGDGAALPGTSADNSEWVRRKINLVRRFLKSSYRVVRERNQPDRLLPPHMAMSQDEYALAGGGFPIRVKGAGIIGTVTVSGLPERDDHGLVVEALALELGHDPASYALPALVG